MRIKHIDGMRAISVLSVLLFHAFPKIFPQGYIGVDYFLFISGFVISRKYLFVESEFSFIDFWVRRIKRLYPQLIVCMLICILPAVFLMQPDLLENFCQSLIATLFGLNNVLLYLTSGYWDSANELKPLFITWSIGLEQQFYLMISLLVPALLNGANYKNFLKCLFFIFVISFGITFLPFPSSNYLLLPSRIWEFSIGIFFAFIYRKNVNFPKYISFISFIIVLGFPFLNFLEKLQSPSPLLILPLFCLGLITIDKSDNNVQRILSNSLIVYIGYASYSIYLYHQPIFAFSRLISYERLSNYSSFSILIVSLFIGIIMYELIENQVRLTKAKEILYSHFNSFKSILIYTLLILFFSISGYFGQGWFKFRFPYLLENGLVPKGFLGGRFYTDIGYSYLYKPFNNDDEKIKLLFIGSSKVRDLINSILLIENFSPIKFDISYIYDFDLDQIKSKNLIEQSDITFFGLGPNSFLPGPLKMETKKIILVKYREDFIYNINPILFEKSAKVRSSIVVGNKKNLSSLISIRKDGFTFIDGLQAFLDPNGFVKLADNDGKIISFDGIHLSESGAQLLSQRLREEGLIQILFDKSR
tara:strand:- start:1440 stop:3203 length:1764 start_codon:yes stop_codon:yes gene_type:complete